jgi:two pore calcium channel protein
VTLPTRPTSFAGYLSPYLRVCIYCVNSPPILHELRLVRRTLRPLSGIAIVLFAFLFFTSWVGILIFSSSEPGSQGAIYFTSLWETMWQLFICLTTANYPDVMMPGYTKSRFSFGFFGFFVIIATFFLLNVVIAVVCNAYNAVVEEEAAENDKFHQARLARAFELLDGPEKSGRLSRERVEQVFAELNHYNLKSIGRIDAERGRVLFGLLDQERDGFLDREEFSMLGYLLMTKLKRVSHSGFIGRLFPSVFESDFVQNLNAFVTYEVRVCGHSITAFDSFIDVLLLINAIILVIEEWSILQGGGLATTSSYLTANTWSNGVDWAFTAVFTLEMVMKLTALGWYDYTASKSNCFDGVITILCLIAAIVAAASSGAAGEHMMRYVLAIRLGRFGRLLAGIPQVSLVVATFMRMLPAAAKLLQVLFVAMFCFSALGGQLFGGRINYGPQYEALQAVSFGQAGYYANNFNDMASGLVVCFELLVVNNWFILCEGFAAVAFMPLVRFFFVGVYVFGVLVCLNIVVAFALDSFNAVYEESIESGAEGDGGAEGDDGEQQSPVREHSQSIAAGMSRYQAHIPSHLGREKSSLRRMLKAAGRPGARAAERLTNIDRRSEAI